MPSCNPPGKPSSSVGANKPINCAKPPCAAKEEENPCPKGKKCWEGDYEKDISVNSYGRYFKKFKFDGTPYNYNFQKKYKIYAPVKTGSEITVEVRFKIEVQPAVIKKIKVENRAKKKLSKAVNKNWNGKFTLEADDSECLVCGKKTFKIKYKISWVNSGQDYTIKIHNIFAREGVSGNVMNVSKSTKPWTYAHEFAHCIGLPDEYSYTNKRESVQYIKPDRSPTLAISAPPGGKPKNGAGATIMSAVGNTKVEKRHGWNIAIEVQDLLKSKLGREIKCKIT